MTLQLFFIKLISGRRLSLLSPRMFFATLKGPFSCDWERRWTQIDPKMLVQMGYREWLFPPQLQGITSPGLQLVLQISGNLVPQPSLCRFHELLYEHGILVITVSSVLWLWDVSGRTFWVWMCLLWTRILISQSSDHWSCLLLLPLILNYYFSNYFYFGCLYGS